MLGTNLYLTLTIIVLSILSAATALNELLLLKSKSNKTLHKVRIIIRSWWIIVSTVLVFGYFEAKGILALFSILNVFIIFEYFRNSKLVKVKKYMKAFLLIIVIIQSALIYFNNFELFTALPLLYILATLPLLIFIDPEVENIASLISSYFGVLFLTHCLFYLPSFVMIGSEILGSPDKAMICFFLMVGLTQTNDVFQFLSGKTFGKTKLVPHISPNKTTAGFVGGLTLTTLLSGVCFNQFIGISLGYSFIIGFCISIFGIFGDLTFSAIKRNLDIKDFGTLLPGHGGLIDRLDSLIFTGPILYALFKYTHIIGG